MGNTEEYITEAQVTEEYITEGWGYREVYYRISKKQLFSKCKKFERIISCMELKKLIKKRALSILDKMGLRISRWVPSTPLELTIDLEW